MVVREAMKESLRSGLCCTSSSIDIRRDSSVGSKTEAQPPTLILLPGRGYIVCWWASIVMMFRAQRRSHVMIDGQVNSRLQIEESDFIASLY